MFSQLKIGNHGIREIHERAVGEIGGMGFEQEQTEGDREAQKLIKESGRMLGGARRRDMPARLCKARARENYPSSSVMRTCCG